MADSLEERAEKLGTLIREARAASEREAADCASAMGVNAETFEAYEAGNQSPSLPELEALHIIMIYHSSFFGGAILSYPKRVIKVRSPNWKTCYHYDTALSACSCAKADPMPISHWKN
ncbi:MAG: helix-turn-helix domain-containing protein [Anaerolineales bacterium]